MGNELALRQLTAEQVDLIKHTIAIGATDDELRLFVAQCNRTQLDPFSRQIHFVKRRGKMTIQTGIDGYRLVAERTGQYAGNDEPVFHGEGQLASGKNHPLKATVTVWRLVNGVRCPYTMSARWDEYYPGNVPEAFMWQKMPFGQLAKCAEALALRKGFPQDLSGVHIREEMDQAMEGPQQNPLTADQVNELTLLCEQADKNLAGLVQWAAQDREKTELSELTQPQYRKARAKLLEAIRQRKPECQEEPEEYPGDQSLGEVPMTVS